MDRKILINGKIYTEDIRKGLKSKIVIISKESEGVM